MKAKNVLSSKSEKLIVISILRTFNYSFYAHSDFIDRFSFV